MFSNKQKVHTNKSRPLSFADDVDIVGKKYPTNFLGRLINRFACLFVITLIIPLLIIFLGLSVRNLGQFNSIAFYQLGNNHPATLTEELTNVVLNDWVSELRGVASMSPAVNGKENYSRIVDRVELRAMVNQNRLKALGPNKTEVSTSSIVEAIASTEKIVKRVDGYEDICLKNDDLVEVESSLNTSLSCAPVSSLTQYYYPRLGEDGVWYMDGTGHMLQKDAPRIPGGPNDLWFLPRLGENVTLMRSQFTFAFFFNSSTSELAKSAYGKALHALVATAAENVEKASQHPYLDFALGGSLVENALYVVSIDKERYKIVITAIVVFFCCGFHTFSIFFGVYAAILMVIIFFTAQVMLSLACKTEPDLALPLIVWVTSFTVHATLGFCDTFRYSGVMPTTGRRNNLTVAQRISFTMRHTTCCVWLSNTIAIVVSSVNTTSFFEGVRLGNIFLIFALLVNMFIIAFPTPAVVALHHYTFSNKRRNLQKQTDIMNRITQGVQRSESIIPLLRGVQKYMPLDVHSPSTSPSHTDDDGNDYNGENENDTNNNNQGPKQNLSDETPRISLKKWIRRSAHDAAANMKLELHQGVTGVTHKVRKTHRNLLHRHRFSSSGHEQQYPRDNDSVSETTKGEVEIPAFCMEDFVEVGPVNPLSDTCATRSLYNNPRMVRPDDILHVPITLTSRSERCWSSMTAALSQSDGNSSMPSSAVAPPHVSPLQDSMEESNWSSFWLSVGEHLGVTGGAGDALLPLAVRALVRSQDPSWVIGTINTETMPGSNHNDNHDNADRDRSKAGAVREGNLKCENVDEEHGSADDYSRNEENEAEQRERPQKQQQQQQQQERENENQTPGATPRVTFQPVEEVWEGAAMTAEEEEEKDERAGWGWRKIRYRWRHRKVHGRRHCWGLFGDRANETPAERDARLMRRKVKREGFSLTERCILKIIVPSTQRSRWVLLTLQILFFVICCSLTPFVKTGPAPTSLLTTRKSLARERKFYPLDGKFGQMGHGEFCGPYYRPPGTYPTSKQEDRQICAAAGLMEQMFLTADHCGVCNGTNTCIDCAGVANGGHEILVCGSCVAMNTTSEDTVCSCEVQRNCPYCEWAHNKIDVGGANCTVPCSPETCGSHGRCDAYTAKCICDTSFTGDTCNACRHGLLPLEINPNCTLECDDWHNSSVCGCDANSGRCTGCPDGMMGSDCNVPILLCEHGTYDPLSNECICDEGYTGIRCALSRNCSSRGAWLSASESPFDSAGCGCVGHWRGPSCQLCDCLNGGMCDSQTGECVCPGAFTGPRCAQCDADCSARGSCPDVPPLSYWNVRTCIEAQCDAADREAERACDVCVVSPSSTSSCDTWNQSSCLVESECWWDQTTTTCGPARQHSVEEVNMLLQCNCSQVWTGGNTCNTCLAPTGGVCTSARTITGCNGVEYSDPNLVPKVDVCGVCGGDGLCRGCDGIPNSGLVLDACGVCDGDGSTCSQLNEMEKKLVGAPIVVRFFLDLRKLGSFINSARWSTIMKAFCDSIHFHWPGERNCFIVDFLDNTSYTHVPSIKSVFKFATENRRYSEAIFKMQGAVPVGWDYMIINVKLSLGTEAKASSIYNEYERMNDFVLTYLKEVMNSAPDIFVLMPIWHSSPFWTSAAAEMLPKQALWFEVIIGLWVTFIIAYVYFVSITMAFFLALCAGFVLFATLMVCLLLGLRLDAVLLFSLAPVIPIAVEYLVHFVSCYYDYLHATTSHLFARDVAREAAFRGAALQAIPSTFTSCITSIIVAVTLNASKVMTLTRTGQIAISAHLIVLVVVLFFGGCLCAVGPMRNFGHWTARLLLTLIFCLLTGAMLLIIKMVGGIRGPRGVTILA